MINHRAIATLGLGFEHRVLASIGLIAQGDLYEPTYLPVLGGYPIKIPRRADMARRRRLRDEDVVLTLLC